MDEVMVEAVARAIHDDYIRHERGAGRTPETNPSMVDWDELPEDLQESNREQARHIDAKVEAIGCEVRPATDPAPAVREFSPQEVEHLARFEHHRWIGERRAAGWTAGLVKDADRKVTPHLVPWEELSEEIKDYDRRTVENIPEVLAAAGLRVVRTEG
jgi:hypothetical protein